MLFSGGWHCWTYRCSSVLARPTRGPRSRRISVVATRGRRTSWTSFEISDVDPPPSEAAIFREAAVRADVDFLARIENIIARKENDERARQAADPAATCRWRSCATGWCVALFSGPWSSIQTIGRAGVYDCNLTSDIPVSNASKNETTCFMVASYTL